MGICGSILSTGLVTSLACAEIKITRRDDHRSTWQARYVVAAYSEDCRVPPTHWSMLHRHQAVNDADRVDRQSPGQLLDNEILVAETKLKKAKASQGSCCGASDRQVAQLEARLAKLRLVKDDRATFDVVVPPGGHAGAVLQVTDPMGRVVTAIVPDGLREGDKFSLPYVKQVPVAQGVVVARATPATGGEPQGGG